MWKWHCQTVQVERWWRGSGTQSAAVAVAAVAAAALQQRRESSLTEKICERKIIFPINFPLRRRTEMSFREKHATYIPQEHQNNFSDKKKILLIIYQQHVNFCVVHKLIILRI